jgi:hypothetical protein
MVRSSRSCAELARPTMAGFGLGLGAGFHSAAVCSGPYSHVTSESLSLWVRGY